MVAFLQETLEDDVQVKTARGRDEPDKNRGGAKVHTQESLHGLSVSPNLWYGIFETSLLEVVFIETKPDPCVYTHGSSDTFVIFILYMNDIVLTGRKAALPSKKDKARANGALLYGSSVNGWGTSQHDSHKGLC